MLGVVSQFEPAGGKVLRNDTVSPPLTGFDLNTQQSREKCRLSGRGRKPGPSGEYVRHGWLHSSELSLGESPSLMREIDIGTNNCETKYLAAMHQFCTSPRKMPGAITWL
jgi:hypothetical protein